MTDQAAHSEQTSDDLRAQTLPGFISFEEKKSGLYATYNKSTFIKDGKVFHEREYLGKVIDKERGLYHSRKRGYFTFDLGQGYGSPTPEEVVASQKPYYKSFHFGDIWLFDQVLREEGLDKILDDLIPNAANAVKALVAFRLLSSRAYDYVEDWYYDSFATYLYPETIVTSGMISAYLEKLGQNEVYDNFF
jgi:hypothetical protein